MTAAAPARPVPDRAPAPYTADDRARALRALGAAPAAVEELLDYGAPFPHAELSALPLPDEPFVATWRAYAAEARAGGAGGAAACLRRHVVQLRFPIRAGVSASEDYRAATLRGALHRAPPPDDWPPFADPAGVRLLVHETPAGAVPVIAAAAREDFETLIRAFARRNEPDPIPPATGAAIVAGYNNWERVAEARRRWAAARGGDCDAAWGEAFAALRAEPARYQDRLVVLSAGPYSAVPASALGMSEDAWRALSLTVRLEHECAHYFTRRLLGRMRNALHDELIADYAGIVAAAGRYRPDWALRFFGLPADATGDDHPALSPHGRLHTYRGKPPLGDAAFATLARVAVRAVRALDAFDRTLPAGTRPPLVAALAAIARLTLEELAADDAVARLRAAHAAACRELRDGVRASARGEPVPVC
jgi:hypothetical protein